VGVYIIVQVGINISRLCAFELFKEFGTSGDHDASDDKFFNLAGIIIPIVGAFGRIVWGLLGDKVSYRTLFIVGNTLSAIFQVRKILAFSFSLLNSKLNVDLLIRSLDLIKPDVVA
jgi:nitrate/nitrite transporter NarK